MEMQLHTHDPASYVIGAYPHALSAVKSIYLEF